MRQIFFSLIISCFLVPAQWCLGQDKAPQITIDETTAAYEKLTDNNYTLTIQWSSYPGAHHYRVRYGYEDPDLDNPSDQLTESQSSDGDATTISLPVQHNSCYVQVLAISEESDELAESCVYRASLKLEKTKKSSGLKFIFMKAFVHSFGEMDPLAGWAIVVLIFLLLLYGVYIALSINREVRNQNHLENKELGKKVDDYFKRWEEVCKSENENKDEKIKELKYLVEEIKVYNKDRFCILNIFEKGLNNHIDNFDRPNVSEEVDRDMEKAIDYELEGITLGKYSKRAKHISIVRIKMFGETAPMFGLLGTVSGLIVAFFNILGAANEGGSYQDLLKELSTGIYSAIVTTIIGLIVGITLLFIHHGVSSNLKRLQNAWLEKYIKISRLIS